MKRRNKEIIKLATYEFLSTLFELPITIPAIMTESNPWYRKSAQRYLSKKEAEYKSFWRKVQYLRRIGMIETFVDKKEKYIALTPKGLEKLKIKQEGMWQNITINHAGKWDGKWRIVIFDIPEKFRGNRDILRFKLYDLGFLQVQKSIYVYPFECTREIIELSTRLLVKDYVLITVSDIIQGEQFLIDKFLSNGMLKQSDLDNNAYQNTSDR